MSRFYVLFTASSSSFLMSVSYKEKGTQTQKR